MFPIKEDNRIMTKLARRSHRTLLTFLLILLFVTSGCAGFGGPGQPASVPEVQPGILAPYLPMASIPDSMVLLPPPPVPGQAAAALDEEVSRKNEALSGSPRWNLAALDAEISFPQAAGSFSCTLGLPITKQDTPYLYRLLHRSFTDAIASTLKAKNHYRRTRPFAAHNTPTCSPEWEKQLMTDGSYPSGHSTVGWTWALILSEADPVQGDALLVRGRAFEESRLVCNVHWQSDVIAGRLMGSAVFARLHSSPEFLADLKAAKTEIAAARAKGLKPSRNCVDEAAVLGVPAASSTK